MSVLVTGGAGYIGSHVALAMQDRGEDVVVLDNLSTGLQSLVPERATFIMGNVGDYAHVSDVLRSYKIDSVIHFAASTVVSDSVDNPLFYYQNNTVSSRTLIAACVDASVKHFIFSSTAAVYAPGQAGLIDEGAPATPITPYGRSKLVTEWILQDVARTGALRYVVLRYFNVAGADPFGRSGQSTPSATHLIKRACQACLGRIPYLEVFGTDYPTSDGTGVRDYIHVSDLSNAHLLALDYLRNGQRSDLFNCGYGRGYSVREIISAVERVSHLSVPARECTRRVGDLAAVVADSGRLSTTLGWSPQHADIDTIVGSALAWERRLNCA